MKKETRKLEYEGTKINNKLVEELLAKADPSKLFGKDGLFNELKKQLIEKVLASELDHEVGYSKHSREAKESDNRRNGSYEKTIIDGEGHKIKLEVPRDREGEYEPQIIPKGVRRFSGFDEKVISLYGVPLHKGT